jgi:3-isopropylmalate/(R)-2-methylmalate dehydratase large subunit
MSMTVTEKIIARAAGKDHVSPGDNVWVNVDILLTHDVCGPGTVGVFQREFGKDAKVWDKDKVVIIPDHYIYTADEKAHRNVDTLRDFAKEQALPHFYDPGTDSYRGVCHLYLPQE